MSCHGRQNLRHCFTERRQAQHKHLESTSRLTFQNETFVKHIYLYRESSKAILVNVTLPDHQICLGTCPQTLQKSGVWPNLVRKALVVPGIKVPFKFAMRFAAACREMHSKNPYCKQDPPFLSKNRWISDSTLHLYVQSIKKIFPIINIFSWRVFSSRVTSRSKLRERRWETHPFTGKGAIIPHEICID